MFSVVISVNSQTLLVIQFYKKKFPRIFGFFEKKNGENFKECTYVYNNPFFKVI